MTDLTGGCACGQVRYLATGAPRFTILCQCRACQQMTGSDHAPQFGHPAQAFSIEGLLTSWERASDDGFAVRKFFCPTCGTPVYSTTTRMDDIVMVLSGTLDDPARVPPQMIVYADHRIPWDHAKVEPAP